jgi:hypothetical protein
MKGVIMTAAIARRLLCKTIEDMPLKKLQYHKIRLLDAWRESTGELYGFEQAVRDGFMVSIASESAKGYCPKNLWLTHNLKCAYEEACRQEKKLLGRKD